MGSMTILLRVIWNALGLLAIAYFIPQIKIENFTAALVVAIVLGILNAFVKPILLILTLPITLLTLGLFSFVISAFLFSVTADFIEGFSVENFWYALLGTILLSAISAVGSQWIK
jgi:putative membrane protein